MKNLFCAVLIFVASLSYAGFDEGFEAYKKGNYTVALKEFKQAAEQGNAHAQFGIGLMYDRGEGVPQDYKQAIEWYTKAAVQGDDYAQYTLGGMYANGRGIPQSYKQAFDWWQKAANQGHIGSQFGIGLMYDRGKAYRKIISKPLSGTPKQLSKDMRWRNLI